MARVVIGLSGGVDSSVAAYLLKQQGHDVVGLFMINWHDTTGTLEGDCPWHDDRVFAELVAKKLDIPLHVVDLSADYRTRVVDYMFSEYEKGRTPNPDVLCNREIKFDVFLREALRLGADFVATGHYCRKAEETLPDGRTIYKLLAGTDPNKDQSYFLCQLSQEQLRYALFPVGALLKPEVRRIAAEQGLATAKRKDSQGICFVGKIDLPAFLQQKLASKRGNVHEILPTWPKYGPKARIPAGTPDAGQAIPAPASPAAGHSAPMSSANTPAANTPAGIGQTVTSPASKPISAAGRPDGDPHSPGGQHAADVPPTTEQLAALAAPWRYTVRDGKKIGEHGGAHFYTIGQRKGLGIGGRKESLFILATDTVQNVIYVGEGDSHPGLWRQALHIAPREIHWPSRPLQRPHPLPPALAGGHALRPRPGRLHPLRRPPAGHHTGAVRRMVRRRRAGRFGGDLGIIPLQPGFSPETPIIRISGKVGLLSATQSCTFWWQKLFLRIPPCTFFRKKYQKLSDGCLACFRRPNAGNGRLTAGLQANLPRFSRF